MDDTRHDFDDEVSGGSRYRRDLDREYVTRYEWRMHIEHSASRDRKIEAHMDRQDAAIDSVEKTVGRAIGAASAVIIIAQAFFTYLATR